VQVAERIYPALVVRVRTAGAVQEANWFRRHVSRGGGISWASPPVSGGVDGRHQAAVSHIPGPATE